MDKKDIAAYFLLLLLGACLLWIQNAYAATFTTHFYEDGDPYILMEGSTEYGDAYRLESAYAEAGSGKMDLWLNGPGGSHDALDAVVLSMSNMDLRTIVDNQDICMSACAVIWSHGKSKAMGTESTIGFHVASLVIDPESSKSLEDFKLAYGWHEIQIQMQSTMRESLLYYYNLPISNPAALVKGILEEGWTADQFYHITVDNYDIIGDVKLF